MSLTLIGSIPSPYVRRIRILLKDQNYDFKVIDLMNNQDQVELLKISPIRRIPVLLDGKNTVYDSRQIHRYLTEKFSFPKLSLDQENDLTFIDGANDALVSVRLLNSSGFDDKGNVFIRNQYKRIKDTLRYFEKKFTGVKASEEDYIHISLYCLVDWIVYRELIPMEEFKNLVSFKEEFSKFESSSKSSPY